MVIKLEELTRKYLYRHQNEEVAIDNKGVNVFIRFNLKSSEKLMVFSNGAVDYKKKTPPVFQRSSWVDDIPINCIFIDDCTIHGLKLATGWGVGNKKNHFILLYSEIIKKICDLLEINNKSTYYFGSSAGGYMSILLSTLHEKSKAIVINPQIYLNSHYNHKAVTWLLNKLFKDLSRNEIIENYRDRLSVISFFKKYKRIPEIYYFQNRYCLEDVNVHLDPFLDDLTKYNIDASSIKIIQYHSKTLGHNPPDKAVTIKILKGIISW